MADMQKASMFAHKSIICLWRRGERGETRKVWGQAPVVEAQTQGKSQLSDISSERLARPARLVVRKALPKCGLSAKVGTPVLLFARGGSEWVCRDNLYQSGCGARRPRKGWRIKASYAALVLAFADPLASAPKRP